MTANPDDKRTVGRAVLRLARGDITQQEVDAIVNAANASLMGGGGVDGAIHRAGGPEIHEQCVRIVSEIGSLPTGEAVVTTGGKLKARYVIHTVGPIWHGGNRNEPALLEKTYRNSLTLAKKEGVGTIAFPSISTGAYRFPLKRAAEIALSTVIDFLRENPIEEVRFVLFSDEDFETYKRALEKFLPSEE